MQVKVEDPNSKQVYQTSVFVSPFGSIHGDFPVPPDAALGYYSISVTTNPGSAQPKPANAAVGDEEGDAGMSSGRSYMSGGFNVEEYKKPEYVVKVTPDKQHLLEGEAISATIEARYYFGEPVAGMARSYKYVDTPCYGEGSHVYDTVVVGAGLKPAPTS